MSVSPRVRPSVLFALSVLLLAGATIEPPSCFAQLFDSSAYPLHVGQSPRDLDAGDLDGDGDVDLVTGTLAVIGKSETWLDVWENKTAKR